jgi:hypothetical protein
VSAPFATPPPHDPIAIALAEDIGAGDLTSRYFVAEQTRRARIFAKEPAIAAGVEVAAEVFRRVDPQLAVEIVRPSGSALQPGDTALFIEGAARSILTAERVALNFCSDSPVWRRLRAALSKPPRRIARRSSIRAKHTWPPPLEKAASSRWRRESSLRPL